MPLILPHHYVIRHALLAECYAAGHKHPATFLFRGRHGDNNARSMGVRGWLRSDGKASSWPMMSVLIRKLEIRGIAFTNEGYFRNGEYLHCVDHAGNAIEPLPEMRTPPHPGGTSGGAIATHSTEGDIAERTPSIACVE